MWRSSIEATFGKDKHENVTKIKTYTDSFPRQALKVESGFGNLIRDTAKILNYSLTTHYALQ